MKNVLIISRWFPPLNMIASKRFGCMCGYFEDYGYIPYVLTSVGQRVKISGFSMDLPSPINEGRILRIGQMDRAYIPHSFKYTIIGDLLERAGLFLNTLSASSLGRYEMIREKLECSKLKNIDIIIATYPEMDSIYVAKFLSKKLGCPYIVDFRDLVEFADGIPTNLHHNIRLDVLIEKICLRDASALVPVTQGYKKILRKRYPHKKIRVVYNGWESSKTEKVLDETSRIVSKYMYYAGTLYEHRLESLTLLLRCIKEIIKQEDISIVIRSAGPYEYDKKMKKIIAEYGMGGYVKILPPTSSDIVKKEQESAYFNVVLSTIHEEDSELMATIPGKVYELLPIERPVLAIVPENSDVDRLLRYTKKGIGTTNKNKIIDFILNRNADCIGNDRIYEFTRENQAKKYCDLIGDVIG